MVFKILPKNTIYGSMFRFEPDSGVIGLDQSQVITVTFEPDVLGDFNENFTCSMEGSDDTLTLSFRGEVIGPTFHFDVEKVDFGEISYGFPTSRTVSLINTSEIDMIYGLRMRARGNDSLRQNSLVASEFGVNPKVGTIGPGQQQEITIHLHPMQEQRYEAEIIVDISSVGDDIYKLPIDATCQIPDVRSFFPFF